MEIEISNHPYFKEVKRKLVFNPLIIDYTKKTANWGFNINHFDAAGNSIANHLPTVQGNFNITNDKLVNPATGNKFADDATEEQLKTAVPEFEFLSAALKKAGVDPLVLGIGRVKVADARQALDDYSKLM
jgi:hypothetical protein